MDLFLDKIPQGPLGLLVFALALALVTVYRNARADSRTAARELREVREAQEKAIAAERASNALELAAERDAHRRTREAKDADGRAFLQMQAEAQSDSMAQVKDLGAVLAAVKEQGARLEAEVIALGRR